MQAPINVNSIRGVIERPLTADEVRVIPQWIDQAVEKLLDAVPDLEARKALPPENPRHVRENVVRDALVNAVERKVRNAGGLRRFGTDEFSSEVDPSLASGKIFISDEDLARFQPRPIAGTSQGVYSMQLEL
ncbi:hypothetical protein [Pseudoclavibacter sp. VKM Ac-2888]|uniref:hypothetical protein n=1 Tax=Pseudoclavibacter sp. VKM Ac-2888 TaxID=2783830 RepID=UPI00188C33AD|nr:hypothetical protein [Pseudoclavibacter sp. VKM Ac-2888]MBF4549240.1 hypothetical protein [Pseudoclavibacter sp. VKM Ac-2888]